MNRRQLLAMGASAALWPHTARAAQAGTTPCVNTPGTIQPEQQKYVDGITTAEKYRESSLAGYSSVETYIVRRRGSFDVAATREVRVEYVRGKGKTYKENKNSRSGSSIIQGRLLDKLISEQALASKPGNREKALLTIDNYQMRLVCPETFNRRPCAKIMLTPRKTNKYVLNGFVLIDLDNCHLVHVEGTLAERPSFLAGYPKVVRDYSDRKGVFLADRVTSTAPSLLLGETTVEIKYEYPSIG
jgi:hypothetical protein